MRRGRATPTKAPLSANTAARATAPRQLLGIWHLAPGPSRVNAVGVRNHCAEMRNHRAAIRCHRAVMRKEGASLRKSTLAGLAESSCARAERTAMRPKDET